jgi:hypothetical protein
VGSVRRQAALVLASLASAVFFTGCGAFLADRAPLPLPPPGALYHGVYPGPPDGKEDGVTPADLAVYERTVGRRVAWVYFSHDWFRGRTFPTSTVEWIREHGAVPYIRLMLRSDSRLYQPESTYTLRHILDGAFDADIRSWANSARRYGSPLLVEYGTEANGDWFAWNGAWNGGNDSTGYGDPHLADGPERFRDAYRRIVRLCREEGARNITWVWHVNSGDAPATAWNRLEEYYPGGEWIDWVGVSVYGTQRPTEKGWPQFAALMDLVYPRLRAVAPSKPVIVSEFGATSGSPLGDQAAWATEALDTLLTNHWPAVIGFSWWNAAWNNDGNPEHNSNMRVQDNPELGEAFRRALDRDGRIRDRFP